MSADPIRGSVPRWYLVPVRVALVTFLLTLLSFALSLLLSIIGLVIAAKFAEAPPNLTHAYRHMALPFSAFIALVVLITATVLETRRYRQAKALSSIERMG